MKTDEELDKLIAWWNETPEINFTESDFYKCKGCGRWDLRHGYEDKSPYCIGCMCEKEGVEIKIGHSP